MDSNGLPHHTYTICVNYVRYFIFFSSFSLILSFIEKVFIAFLEIGNWLKRLIRCKLYAHTNILPPCDWKESNGHRINWMIIIGACHVRDFSVSFCFIDIDQTRLNGKNQLEERRYDVFIRAHHLIYGKRQKETVL